MTSCTGHIISLRLILPANEEVTVRIDLNETVTDLKLKAEREMPNFPASRQRVLWGGRQLADPEVLGKVFQKRLHEGVLAVYVTLRRTPGTTALQPAVPASPPPLAAEESASPAPPCAAWETSERFQGHKALACKGQYSKDAPQESSAAPRLAPAQLIPHIPAVTFANEAVMAGGAHSQLAAIDSDILPAVFSKLSLGGHIAQVSRVCRQWRHAGFSATAWKGVDPALRSHGCHQAVLSMNISLLKTLLGSGANSQVRLGTNLPIHHAAASKHPEASEAIRLLIAASPTSAAECDGLLRNPLHLVLETAGPSLLKSMRQLLQAAPQIARSRDTYDNSPLFIALSLVTGPQPHPDAEQVCRLLLEVCPEAATDVAQFNKLPLHMVAPGVTTAALPVAQAVYSAYPAAAGRRDRAGSYAYQYSNCKEMAELQKSWYELAC